MEIAPYIVLYIGIGVLFSALVLILALHFMDSGGVEWLPLILANGADVDEATLDIALHVEADVTHYVTDRHRLYLC